MRHRWGRNMQDLTPKCCICSSLDPSRTLTGFRSGSHWLAVDPHSLLCWKVIFPKIALADPALSPLHQQGKLNGIRPVMNCMLKAYSRVRNEGRTVLLLRRYPKAINICLCRLHSMKDTFSALPYLSCLQYEYTCPGLFHGPIPAIPWSCKPFSFVSFPVQGLVRTVEFTHNHFSALTEPWHLLLHLS